MSSGRGHDLTARVASPQLSCMQGLGRLESEAHSSRDPLSSPRGRLVDRSTHCLTDRDPRDTSPDLGIRISGSSALLLDGVRRSNDESGGGSVVPIGVHMNGGRTSNGSGVVQQRLMDPAALFSSIGMSGEGDSSVRFHKVSFFLLSLSLLSLLFRCVVADWKEERKEGRKSH